MLAVRLEIKDTHYIVRESNVENKIYLHWTQQKQVVWGIQKYLMQLLTY